MEKRLDEYKKALYVIDMNNGFVNFGANGMANNGYSYSDILKHYYSGVTISYQ